MHYFFCLCFVSGCSNQGIAMVAPGAEASQLSNVRLVNGIDEDKVLDNRLKLIQEYESSDEEVAHQQAKIREREKRSAGWRNMVGMDRDHINTREIIVSKELSQEMRNRAVDRYNI